MRIVRCKCRPLLWTVLPYRLFLLFGVHGVHSDQVNQTSFTALKSCPILLLRGLPAQAGQPALHPGDPVPEDHRGPPSALTVASAVAGPPRQAPVQDPHAAGPPVRQRPLRAQRPLPYCTLCAPAHGHQVRPLHQQQVRVQGWLANRCDGLSINNR